MSNIIKIKNSDLPMLIDAYGKVSTAHISDPDIHMAEKAATAAGEDVPAALRALKDSVGRVTYAAGKNYNRLQSAAKARDTKVQTLDDSYDDPRFELYDEKRIQICELYADKDESGKPIFRPIQNSDARNYAFSGKNRKLVKKALADLKELYKEAFDALDANQKAMDAKVDAIDAEEVEIKIYQVPWACKPVAVSGAYLHLEEHGVVLPEQSESIGKVIGCNIKLDQVIAIDNQFIRWQDKLVILHRDLK